MFNRFNLLFEKLINYGMLYSKGHNHRNEKGFTDMDSTYLRKHLNMVPKYTQPSQDSATQKIRNINYDNSTKQQITSAEASKILQKYNIKFDTLLKKGFARLGRSKCIIKYNPNFGTYILYKNQN